MMKILFTDTETTGMSANPGKNELVQLGCMMTTGRNIIESIDLTSKPMNEDAISPQALEVTHKTKADLLKYADPKTSFDAFYNFVTKHFSGEKIKIAGQNVKFDIRFLTLWWNTWKSPDQLPIDHFFDLSDPYELMDMTKELKKLGILVVDNVKLGTVANALMIQATGELHNAMTDIDITHKIMFNIIDRLALLNNEDITSRFKRYMALR